MKEEPRTINVGLIGCGSQGRYLSEAARLIEGVRLVACADINPEAAQRAVEQCGYEQTYPSAEDLLAEAPVEAVIVATVHDQLQPMALAALQAGKHVLVEKPMALDAVGGAALVTAAAQADLVLMVGYTLRFMPTRLFLKHLLDEGAIGEVTQVLAGQCIGGLGGWLATPEHGGGPLLYVGTHALDQLLWTAGGEVEEVFAEINPAPSGVEAEAFITLRFADGKLGQLVCSQTLGGRYGWLDLLGSEGRMRSEWESDVVTVQSRKVPAYSHVTQVHVPPTAYLPAFRRDAQISLSGTAYLRAWGAELAEFLAAVREGRQPAVTGEDGLRVLEVLDAARLSALEGCAVSLA